MDLLVISLHETDNNKLQMAAVGCLHSLSRSVQLLRTTFQDHPVWKPLISILESPNSSAECQVLASSTLCDLLLEFSPSKEPILDSGAIDLMSTDTQIRSFTKAKWCLGTYEYGFSIRSEN